MKTKWRIALNLIFAIAMAWVEAALVLYLRTMVDRIDPYQVNPIPLNWELGWIELIREAATLIMLLSVGGLSGRSTGSRLAYAVIAFSVWDIFYYLFLWMMGNWPTSLMDWDILFLLPLPWWGPVLAPILIALVLAIGGFMMVILEERSISIQLRPTTILLATGGALLALYVFMQDALAVFSFGTEAILTVLPTSFNWPLFANALLLMAFPVFELMQQIREV